MGIVTIEPGNGYRHINSLCHHLLFLPVSTNFYSLTYCHWIRLILCILCCKAIQILVYRLFLNILKLSQQILGTILKTFPKTCCRCVVSITIGFF